MKGIVVLVVIWAMRRLVTEAATVADEPNFRGVHLLDAPKEEELRALGIHVGYFNPTNQSLIDKRELETRGYYGCQHCNNPSLPPHVCVNGYRPIFHPGQSGCTCVERYECCSCSPPVKNCVDGKSYPVSSTDCCNCLEYVCRPCIVYYFDRTTPPPEPHYQFFECPNPCDEPHKVSDKYTKCERYICNKKPGPIFKPPKCDPQCQEVQRITDKCGNHKDICRCDAPPDCWPSHPGEKKCHKLKLVPLNTYGCKNGACVQCQKYVYIYQPGPQITNKCLECQDAEVIPLPCNGFKIKCQCRDFKHCRPKEPDAPPCYKVEKIWETKVSVCDEYKTSCLACFHYEFVPIKPTHPTPWNPSHKNCDPLCQYPRPSSTGCGSTPICDCVEKEYKFCRPLALIDPCFKAVKRLLTNSYICNPDKTSSQTCIQCHTFTYERIKCKPPPKCPLKCQKLVQQHAKCGCYEYKCEHIRIEDCTPSKPIQDAECFGEPIKEYHHFHAYDDVTWKCVQCFSYKREKKYVHNKNNCDLTHLPDICYYKYTVPGKCGEDVTECRQAQDVCQETYKGDPLTICPKSLTFATFKSRCGRDRDVCVDCSKIVHNPLPQQYSKDCYDIQYLTVLGYCKVPIYHKKDCPHQHLTCDPCPHHGQKRVLQYDKCNCPSLLCTGAAQGCPNNPNNQADIQFIVDSSGSVQPNLWFKFLEAIQEFMKKTDTAHTHYAFSRYGSSFKIIRSLKDPFSFVDLNNPHATDFNYVDMYYTHTASALKHIYPSFHQETRPNSKRYMILLTDGDENQYKGAELHAAAKKWADGGVTLFALGVENVSEALTLKVISPQYGKRFNTVGELKQYLLNIVVPWVCNSYPPYRG